MNKRGLLLTFARRGPSRDVPKIGSKLGGHEQRAGASDMGQGAAVVAANQGSGNSPSQFRCHNVWGCKSLIALQPVVASSAMRSS